MESKGGMIMAYIPDMTERYPEGLSSEFIPDVECRAWADYAKSLEKDREMEAAGFVFDCKRGWHKPDSKEVQI